MAEEAPDKIGELLDDAGDAVAFMWRKSSHAVSESVDDVIDALTPNKEDNSGQIYSPTSARAIESPKSKRDSNSSQLNSVNSHSWSSSTAEQSPSSTGFFMNMLDALTPGSPRRRSIQSPSSSNAPTPSSVRSSARDVLFSPTARALLSPLLSPTSATFNLLTPTSRAGRTPRSIHALRTPSSCRAMGPTPKSIAWHKRRSLDLTEGDLEDLQEFSAIEGLIAKDDEDEVETQGTRREQSWQRGAGMKASPR
eukprot:TRINITY_DN703_c0_g1_i3.p1 TRINITY_DN703_c0_g1~~TRINITY_DN703_c0_g1_i3.p1  ORF type:complete len:252 (-),score=44.17 TRINITY_DN703_c0_g1_i3:319-1074(-)